MLQFIYRIFVFTAMLGVVIAAAVGLTALAPGAATFPFFFMLLLIPAFVFMLFTYQVIYDDTIRRVANRGRRGIAEVMRKRGRNLNNVIAKKANLTRLNLEGFSMQGANLEGAKLNGSSAASIDMSRAQARRSRMNRGIFKNGRFLKSNLRKSRMRYSDFSGANFTDADMREANLKGANLSHANLEGANLKGAIFNGQTKLPFDRNNALERGMVYV